MDPKQPHSYTDPDTYQTGRTQPPRRYSGLVAFLLVLVILLCGISTGLSILNFKLYRQLSVQETTPQVAFSRADDGQQTAAHSDDDITLPCLGISGTVIPEVYQRYYKLPNGFYITQVTSGSQAAQQGLMAGDIVTAVNDVTIVNDDTILELADRLTSGQELRLTLYRGGSELSASLIWED